MNEISDLKSKLERNQERGKEKIKICVDVKRRGWWGLNEIYKQTLTERKGMK